MLGELNRGMTKINLSLIVGRRSENSVCSDKTTFQRQTLHLTIS